MKLVMVVVIPSDSARDMYSGGPSTFVNAGVGYSLSRTLEDFVTLEVDATVVGDTLEGSGVALDEAAAVDTEFTPQPDTATATTTTTASGNTPVRAMLAT